MTTKNNNFSDSHSKTRPVCLSAIFNMIHIISKNNIEHSIVFFG